MADYIKREDALSVAHKIEKKEYEWGNISNAAIVMVVEDDIRAIPAADVVERKEAIPIGWIWEHADEFYSASQRHSDAPFSEDAMEDSEYVEAIKARGVLSLLVTSYRFELKGADMRGEDDG